MTAKDAPWWDGPWPWIIGLVVTVLLGVPSLVVMWRRRGELECYLVLVSRLLDPPTSDLVGRLSLQLDGEPISDPWFCIVTVANRSIKDVITPAFDQERPIRLSLNAKIELVKPWSGTPQLKWRHEQDQILLGPDLIKGRSRWQALAITQGPPRLTIEEEKLNGFRFVPPKKARRREDILTWFLCYVPLLIASLIFSLTHGGDVSSALFVVGIATLLSPVMYLLVKKAFNTSSGEARLSDDVTL